MICLSRPPLCAALLALLATSCNVDTNTVVGTESRLAIASLFVVNGNNAVTLGWTAPLPPMIPKAPAEGGPDEGRTALANVGGDPSDAGTPSSVLVYRGEAPDFQISGAALLAEVSAILDRYADSTVVNGNVYYYRVVPVGELPGGARKYGDPTAPAIGRPYDYSGVTEIGYGEHVDRIFSSGCAVSGCHAGSPAPDAGHDDEFFPGSWEDLIRGGPHGSVVVAFKPSKSHLLFHLNDDTLRGPVSSPHMPLPGFQLPREQMDILTRWVAEGCRNDVGAIPFTTWPGGRVLITNQAEDLVAVIDRATNLTGRYLRAGAANTDITPPEAPHNVTVDEARGVFYVNLIGSGKVLKYRLDDNDLIDEAVGIISPTQVALSPTGDTAYVAQFATGVNAIKVLRTFPLGELREVSAPGLDKPHGVQVTPDGKELWVTGNLSDNIMVVDLSDFSTRLVQLNNQPPGEGGVLLPYQTVMTADNKKVYVTCQRGNTVAVVDRQTYAVRKSIAVGLDPLIPSITPDDRFVLVPNRNSDDLSVIDTQTDSVVRTVAEIGPQPHGSAVTPDGRFAYVSCENVTAPVPPHHPTVGSRNPGFFTIVDLGTWTVKARYETGAFASGVAITNR